MATISERSLDERNGTERPGSSDRAMAERTKAVDAAILAIETTRARPRPGAGDRSRSSESLQQAILADKPAVARSPTGFLDSQDPANLSPASTA